MEVDGAPENFEGSSAEQLIEKANSCVDSLELEQARSLFQQALQIDPNNSDTWRILGEVECEIGDPASAKEHFNKSLEISPNHFAYLNLAQLSDTPLEALHNYSSAILILEELLSANPSSLENRRSTSRALVGMTELYLTDLCFEDNAEHRCEELLSKALETDPSDPEAHQTLASVRLSQSRPEDASKLLHASWNLWRDEEANSPDIPSYESRISLSQLFLETKEYSSAIEVLAQLLSENEDDKQLQYLSGLAWCLLAETKTREDKAANVNNEEDEEEEETFASCIEDAKTHLETLRQYCTNSPEEEDNEMIQQLDSEISRLLSQ